MLQAKDIEAEKGEMTPKLQYEFEKKKFFNC
jgi:hypothetical protein